MAPKPRLSNEEAVALVREHGGIRPASRATGVPYTTLNKAYRRAGAPKLKATGDAARAIDKAPEVHGRIGYRDTYERPLPAKGRIKRYILTCAQNNTELHADVWENLTALAQHYGAELLVSRFTYDKSYYAGARSKPETGRPGDYDDVWYDERILPFVCDERTRLAPGLIWCGEMNILPTAIRPLSGLEAYTGRHSGIFPHVKLAMESVASHKSEATKFNYTTGTVTARNYIQKKVGLKAEFHHCYGGLLAEVDSSGSWWVRQLNADSDGTIYDLDLCASGGRVTGGHRVEAITWGDIHEIRLDPANADAAWGPPGGVALALRPRFQFLHDVLDFRGRNHHEVRDPHRRFQRHVENEECVEAEVARAATWLADRAAQAKGWGGDVVVVDSNHDNALTRWLREADYRNDPVNALFFLDAQRAVYASIAQREAGFHTFEWACKRAVDSIGARFLREDESFVICHDRNGGIECGMHGDLGPNGARGSAVAFARMGRKANIGHSHTACIRDGIYQAGTSSSLDLGYNRGPSSWSHSHVVTYKNGKRAVLTVWRGRARA